MINNIIRHLADVSTDLNDILWRHIHLQVVLAVSLQPVNISQL